MTKADVSAGTVNKDEQRVVLHNGISPEVTRKQLWRWRKTRGVERCFTAKGRPRLPDL